MSDYGLSETRFNGLAYFNILDTLQEAKFMQRDVDVHHIKWSGHKSKMTNMNIATTPTHPSEND